jgi:hypothetical protein
MGGLAPRGCGKLAWSRPEQGVGGGAASALAVDLGLGAGDFRLQDINTLLQFGDAEQFQVFTDRFDQALAAANADFGRFFHDGLYLSGSPMGGYPTAHAAKAQVSALSRPPALPEFST